MLLNNLQKIETQTDIWFSWNMSVTEKLPFFDKYPIFFRKFSRILFFPFLPLVFRIGNVLIRLVRKNKSFRPKFILNFPSPPIFERRNFSFYVAANARFLQFDFTNH